MWLAFVDGLRQIRLDGDRPGKISYYKRLYFNCGKNGSIKNNIMCKTIEYLQNSENFFDNRSPKSPKEIGKKTKASYLFPMIRQGLYNLLDQISGYIL